MWLPAFRRFPAATKTDPTTGHLAFVPETCSEHVGYLVTPATPRHLALQLVKLLAQPCK